MSHPTDPTPTAGKIRLRKEGRRWAVTFPCDCMDLSFPRHHVALIFATHHACPPPWAPIPAAQPYVKGGGIR